MRENTAEVFAALKEKYGEVIQGKGGFWVKEIGFISLLKARRITGIQAPKRNPRNRILAWGDWGAIAAFNRIKPENM